jgi:hypothetical protein
MEPLALHVEAAQALGRLYGIRAVIKAQQAGVEIVAGDDPSDLVWQFAGPVPTGAEFAQLTGAPSAAFDIGSQPYDAFHDSVYDGVMRVA